MDRKTVYIETFVMSYLTARAFGRFAGGCLAKDHGGLVGDAKGTV